MQNINTNHNQFHGNNIKIFAANATPKMAQQIAQCLGLDMGKSEVTCFSDGEISVSVLESVRGSDCFIIQSTCAPVNNNLMELLLMMDAFKRASAARITAVIPYFGYARQDRKAKARDPISAKLVADLISAAGADRILSMDLHVPQLQGFFDLPVDHLLGAPMLAAFFKKKIEEENGNVEDYVVVSPDLGSVTRARSFAAKIGCPLAIVDKRRQKANVSEVMNIIGDVRGKKVILVDDMIDTAGTLCKAAEVLMSRNARSVRACATHGLLSGEAVRRIHDSVLEEVFITDTIPHPELENDPKIRIVSMTEVFASIIHKVYNYEAISPDFVQ